MMTLITRWDLWIASRVFAPPIIGFCRLTRQTPNAVYRLFWFAATLDGLYRAQTAFFISVFVLLSGHMMFSASLHADRPARSFLVMRFIALEFFAIMLMQGVFGNSTRGCEFWLMVLIAEYAATVRLNE